MRWEEMLVGGWSIGHPFRYVGSAIVLSISVRAVLSLIRALKPERPEYVGRSLFSRGWLRFVGVFLRSWGREIWPSPSFDLDPWFVGTIELRAYPVLMRLHAWPVIGAWLGFKTLAQWDAWKRGRAQYNQFLIGNALVVCAAFLLVHHVEPDHHIEID
jgi:hypothetical protein